MKFPVLIPFVEELGMELQAMGDGRATLTVDLRDAHLNSWEVAHGGVMMTLLDVAMAHAARSLLHGRTADGPGVVTLEMKTSFMRPGLGRLRAEGVLLHRATTLAFTEGSVFNEAGELCAHATATFKFIHALPTGKRRLNALKRQDDATGDAP